MTIVMRKSTLIDDMLGGLATLPLTSLEAFQSDARDVAAAESFLRRAGVLDEACGEILLDVAAYRNRLTHFYDEVTAAELFDICAHRSAEIRQVRDAMLYWLRRHSELVDGEL